jgi:hypothetical protein
VESLRQRYELQELELQKSAKKAQEAMALAAEESTKSKAAKEVIKSLTAQVFFWFIDLLVLNWISLEIVCSSSVNALFVECFAL